MPSKAGYIRVIRKNRGHQTRRGVLMDDHRTCKRKVSLNKLAKMRSPSAIKRVDVRGYDTRGGKSLRSDRKQMGIKRKRRHAPAPARREGYNRLGRRPFLARKRRRIEGTIPMAA